MLVSGEETVVVQGMTGGQGRFWSGRMIECGAEVVAGVSPGRAGHEVHGVPVYSSVAEAVRHHDIGASVLFVPPLRAKDAALDALESGIKKLVLLAEHIPYQDTMEILAEAEVRGARVLGPNTAGLVVPGQTSLGIMPAFAANIFQPGRIGVISRSGSLGTLMALQLVSGGFGQSAFVGIGGDPILGTTAADAIDTLHEDDRTDAIVLVGEIGGAMEEDAATCIREIDKPVVAFVAGRSAPADRRMGHAGAIVTGDKGSGPSKVRELAGAGATVIDVPSQVVQALEEFGVYPSAAGAMST